MHCNHSCPGPERQMRGFHKIVDSSDHQKGRKVRKYLGQSRNTRDGWSRSSHQQPTSYRTNSYLLSQEIAKYIFLWFLRHVKNEVATFLFSYTVSNWKNTTAKYYTDIQNRNKVNFLIFIDQMFACLHCKNQPL